MRIYNTMSRSVEPFESIEQGKVGMYCCGPTVYNYAHIGNLRTYIFEDVLRRVLEKNGYDVKHVMNITDVGHLTGDGDDGEDKMSKSAKEQGRSVWDIAAFYTKAFMDDITSLNIEKAKIICKATDHIADMIEVIKELERRGHTYTADGNVYFSIDTIDDYGKLARLNLDELREGARIEVDSAKRNPKDFVLWFTNSKFKDQVMVWDSPWGRGYPGWHIECSAMSSEYLGPHFDIHCGGIDAIPVHHTNEIAQSEAAFGVKPWVDYWCHGEFLLNDSGKMSKSSGEFLTLESLIGKGFDPLDWRYFCLTGHYRSQLKFSFEALESAKSARGQLVRKISSMLSSSDVAKELSEKALDKENEFFAYMSDDLRSPQALATLWSLLKDDGITDGEKLKVLYDVDSILGLRLSEVKAEEALSYGKEEEELLRERTEAKKMKNFKRADEIRDILSSRGFKVIDTPAGAKLERL